jgi:hypothetical protein
MRLRRLFTGHVSLIALAVIGGLVALLFAGSAGATRVIAGNLIVDYTIDFKPAALPRVDDVPVTFSGSTKFTMADGSYPPVPTDFEAEFDNSGHIETRGLPTCRKAQLIATTPAQARRACRDAIVGTGFGTGVVFPEEQAPIPASSPITFFNGPRIHGEMTLYAHSFITDPLPTVIIVTARIKRINDDYFGTRVNVDVPRLPFKGTVTYFRIRIDRKWHYRGREMAYLSAHCPKPGPRIVARQTTRFSDGTSLSGSLFFACQVRKD